MVIGRRALNRTTLERQLLLRRADLSTVDAVGRLVGLQAQAVNAPYLGLWSRLAGFELGQLTERLHDRSVVRASVLRGTQHLVRAEDYGWLRPLIAPVLARNWQAAFGRSTAGMDLAELESVAHSLLAGRTLTRPQLRDMLVARWPERDALALAWSVQALLPVVHPPPNGTWRRGGATPFVLAADWLGRPDAPDPAELVRRYLAAFGPATVADLQLWSGVRGLGEVVSSLDLVLLSDEDGRELYDLPDMSYPDADTPAPVRFLPEFDNLLVAYADRTRMMPDAYRKRVCVGAMVAATVLVDGTVRGTWTVKRDKESATLTIELFETLRRRDRDAVDAEGVRLLDFAAADVAHRDVAWKGAT